MSEPFGASIHIDTTWRIVVSRMECENEPLSVSGFAVARIQVLVSATSPDIQAEGIAAAVDSCVDMALVGGRVVPIGEVEELLAAIPRDPPRVLVLVGGDEATGRAEEWLLQRRNGLVVIRVAAPFGDRVRTAFSDIGLQNLLNQIRVLADPLAPVPTDGTPLGAEAAIKAEGPLLRAGIAWLHAVLRDAAASVAPMQGELAGLTVSPLRVVTELEARNERRRQGDARDDANAVLDRTLAQADARDEPLSAVVSALELTALELRVVLLALAPELDARYQRCIGLLLDDLGRRVPTLGLCAGLLGDSVDVRFQLEASGNLARWRLFDRLDALLPPSDEPLRLDPAIVGWILGDDEAPLRDPHVRRLFRFAAWPGSDLLVAPTSRAHAAAVVRRLATAAQSQWLLLGGGDAPGWRAVLELGARVQESGLLRLDGASLAACEVTGLEDIGTRIGRATLLCDRPLVVDLATIDDIDGDEALGRGLAAIGRTGCSAGVVCHDDARMARLLGAMPFDLVATPPLSESAHASALCEAAGNVGVSLSEPQARHALRRFALSIGGIDEAMRLTAASATADATPEQRLDDFLGVCRKVASDGLSRLAERLDPVFVLDDVVLPPDRRDQLDEIVDNVLFSDRVLNEWAFGEKLPYGRGIAALFHGPSGTGKTMAALAVAKKLGIQVLRIDLSRVVSKYIGETEKNIDRVFEDAQRSGSVLLIDEADALFGKRSEVRDAHDRYANIEVAYLLQRMEAYEGLAILTTNLRQNLDSGFLRRLRFIVDFPRPDASARERIWRHCLPPDSHELDDAAFRLLGRRVDLSGGHIRQITLRAAFIAAAAGTKIELAHIARATNSELAKLGLSPVSLDPSVRRAA